jgi:hypothetical protein
MAPTADATGRLWPVGVTGGQPAELLGIDEPEGAAVGTDVAARLERPQHLVHGLAGAAHHGGQLPLGDLAGGGARPAVLGQQQQLPGDPAGKVQEHQVGHLAGGAAHDRAQQAQQRLGHLLLGAQQPQQLSTGDDQQDRALHRLRRGRARAAVQHRQLAEDGRSAVADQLHDRAVAGGDVQLHHALGEDVHPVAGLVLDEHELPALHQPLGRALGHQSPRAAADLLEQLDPRQHVGPVLEVHVAADLTARPVAPVRKASRT